MGSRTKSTDLPWGDGEPQFEYNNTYSTYPFTAHAVGVIEKLEADTPLFLYMPYQNVHWPLEAPQEFMDMFAHIPDSARQVRTQPEVLRRRLALLC